MVRRRARAALLRIQQCAQDGLLLYTGHARQEMNDDGLMEPDVSTALLRGVLLARQTRGPRGTRYVVQGQSTSGLRINVVCRLSPIGVRVVTVFRV